MGRFTDFLLLLLSQFSGGPGPIENNLVRFGLPAIFWAILLVITLKRQRTQDLPRERLLVWGFGLGLARETYMFGQMAWRILSGTGEGAQCTVIQPLEHALAMAAIVVVAGAFLRYILDDRRLARSYLVIGVGITAICLLVTSWVWPRQLAAHPQAKFHQSWGAWLFHVPLSVLIAYAIGILGRRRGWLSNVVTVALAFFFLGEFLLLVNYATDRVYSDIICPIGNSFHTLAVPLLGYVYLEEQAIEKRKAEEALGAYRDHLEELVEERTSELSATNRQLQQEISDRKQAETERKRAEDEIAQRNVRLAAQNAVADTLSQSLDLETVLNTALDVVLAVLEVDVGFLFLLDPDDHKLSLQIHRGQSTIEDLKSVVAEQCPCVQISTKAVAEMQAVVLHAADDPGCQSWYIDEERLQALVSAPLISQGRAVGALTLGARRSEAIQQAELDLLTAMGQQIGMAVENARLYRETEHWAEDLTLLQQVSICLTSTLEPTEIYDQIAEQSAKLLGCPMSCVYEWKPEHQHVNLAAGYGLQESDRTVLETDPDLLALLSESAARGPPIAIGDLRHDAQIPSTWQETLDIHALLCLPVGGADRPLGFVFLMDRQVSRRWRMDELALVENFCSRAAVALTNAHLHKQLEWSAALEERQRIAANMHDGVAQILGLVSLRMDRVDELVGSGQDQEATQELCRVREAVEQASHAVRRSIASLQEGPEPQHSLQDLLTDLVAQATTGGGLEVQLDLCTEKPLFLSIEHKNQVLPIVQEALLNVRHHAQAEQVRVILSKQDGQVTITVRDDGRGFSMDEVQSAREGHFGMSIMRARAARIGADLVVESEPGQGTQVHLSWTLDQDSPRVPRANGGG